MRMLQWLSDTGWSWTMHELHAALAPLNHGCTALVKSIFSFRRKLWLAKIYHSWNEQTNDSQSCKKRDNYLNTFLSLLLSKCNNMYVEILAYSSSDWRSISQKKPLCKLMLNRDQSYWQRAKIICLLSLPMVFPYWPGFFFSPHWLSS